LNLPRPIDKLFLRTNQFRASLDRLKAASITKDMTDGAAQ
jgi:hypothetical protein